MKIGTGLHGTCRGQIYAHADCEPGWLAFVCGQLLFRPMNIEEKDQDVEIEQKKPEESKESPNEGGKKVSEKREDQPKDNPATESVVECSDKKEDLSEKKEDQPKAEGDQSGKEETKKKGDPPVKESPQETIDFPENNEKPPDTIEILFAEGDQPGQPEQKGGDESEKKDQDTEKKEDKPVMKDQQEKKEKQPEERNKENQPDKPGEQPTNIEEQEIKKEVQPEKKKELAKEQDKPEEKAIIPEKEAKLVPQDKPVPIPDLPEVGQDNTVKKEDLPDEKEVQSEKKEDKSDKDQDKPEEKADLPEKKDDKSEKEEDPGKDGQPGKKEELPKEDDIIDLKYDQDMDIYDKNEDILILQEELVRTMGEEQLEQLKGRGDKIHFLAAKIEAQLQEDEIETPPNDTWNVVVKPETEPTDNFDLDETLLTESTPAEPSLLCHVIDTKTLKPVCQVFHPVVSSSHNRESTSHMIGDGIRLYRVFQLPGVRRTDKKSAEEFEARVETFEFEVSLHIKTFSVILHRIC